MEKLNLNGRLVGPGEPPYIVAEIGSNHNGDMDLCRKMVRTAKECGAHAVKFQSWSEKSLISAAEFRRNTEYADKHKHFGSLKEMVFKYQLTPDQHREIADFSKSIDVDFFSSPFAREEVDLLADLNVPSFKIASMDVNNLRLLEHVASKHKPVMLSTGMATLGEIERAVRTLQDGGSGAIALLHCISIYPPIYSDIHLRNMQTLSQAFELPVGFSDHSIGTAIPLAAIALGACIIEKHFTLDRSMAGWDHGISAEPDELRSIAEEGRNIFYALGSAVRTVSKDEMAKRKKFRRRIVARRQIAKGELLSEQDLDFKRPGNGIDPDELKYVLGRRASRDLEEDAEIEWGDLA